jgi:hypothetical protein
MFNLLPRELKDAIIKEYKLRRLTLLLVFAICVEASFLIFLFPTWLVSSYREREVTARADEMRSEFDPTASPQTGAVKAINAKLNIIDSALEYPKLLPFVDLVISKKTSAISIDEFTYDSTASSTAHMSVQGVSETREALVAFQKRLADSNAFASVDLPISNLAKDKNIEFTIELAIGGDATN